MDFIQVYSHSRFLSIAHKIKQQPAAWQVIDVAITGKTKHNPSFIAMKLKHHFSERDGLIILCSGYQLLVIVNLGESVSIPTLAAGIENSLPEDSCFVEAASLSDAGIVKLQVRLHDIEAAEPDNHLLKARRDRPVNVIMVVDDDQFIRLMFRKLIGGSADVIEAHDKTQALEAYLDVVPDAAFIDVHLPDGSGIELIREILNFDDSAFLVGMSIDSVKKNVLEVQESGAMAFLCKPFTPETIRSSLEKCETFARN